MIQKLEDCMYFKKYNINQPIHNLTSSKLKLNYGDI